MWSSEVISKVSECVRDNGILVTYCAKGSVRRTFASTGLFMERLPGPSGQKGNIKGEKAFVNP